MTCNLLLADSRHECCFSALQVNFLTFFAMFLFFYSVQVARLYVWPVQLIVILLYLRNYMRISLLDLYFLYTAVNFGCNTYLLYLLELQMAPWCCATILLHHAPVLMVWVLVSVFHFKRVLLVNWNMGRSTRVFSSALLAHSVIFHSTLRRTSLIQQLINWRYLNVFTSLLS